MYQFDTNLAYLHIFSFCTFHSTELWLLKKKWSWEERFNLRWL